jgi:hypothetical protein
MNVVTRSRALKGREVLIFDALEHWEASGWPDRPAIVDHLRALTASTVDDPQA